MFNEQFRVTISTNAGTNAIIATADMTVMEAFKRAGLPLGSSTVFRDGLAVGAADCYNKTLEEIGVVDGSALSGVVKAVNA